MTERLMSVECITDQPELTALSQNRQLQTPATGGNFPLVNPEYSLGQVPRTAEEICMADHTDYLQHQAFGKYMRMHKVLVGRSGAEELEDIYHNLKNEPAPRLLFAAGSAAVEVALVRRDWSAARRTGLLDDAKEIWKTAIEHDAFLEPYTPNERVEHGQRNRIALNIAALPLLEGIVTGDVTRDTCRKVFNDCLDIGLKNVDDIHRMIKAKNNEGIAGHAGIGYEANALLAFNRMLSRTWFAVPSIARSDTGYHHRNQTHDLLVIHQDYGQIVRATPVEIKSKASLRDRIRYDALLVRGKMHLSVEGKSKPEYTLQAIDAVHKGRATEEDLLIANNATERLVAMVRDYYAGQRVGKLATWHTVTTFQDNAIVAARHPGLSREPILA